MSVGSDRLVIRSDLSELEKLFAFVERFCINNGVRNEIKYKLFLVAEELTVNVMSHGYKGRPDGMIEIALACDAGGVEVWVEDEAPAFDPLGSAPEALTDAALADRPIGGLGVHLVKTLAKTMDYRFRGGRNVVRATVGDAA